MTKLCKISSHNLELSDRQKKDLTRKHSRINKNGYNANESKEELLIIEV